MLYNPYGCDRFGIWIYFRILSKQKFALKHEYDEYDTIETIIQLFG